MKVDIITGNRVAVRLLELPDKTPGGIYLTHNRFNTKDKTFRGIVTHVGQGRISKKGVMIKPDFEIGDVVMFDKYKGYEAEENNCIILEADDILAKL